MFQLAWPQHEAVAVHAWPVCRADDAGPGRLPSGLFPVTMRTTGHGISAGIGKLGAFIGVFLFPVLQSSLGRRDTLALTAGVSALGFALTLVLPEPAGLSLDDITASPPDTVTRSRHMAGQASPP